MTKLDLLKELNEITDTIQRNRNTINQLSFETENLMADAIDLITEHGVDIVNDNDKEEGE